jgi:signal peptidase I
MKIIKNIATFLKKSNKTFFEEVFLLSTLIITLLGMRSVVIGSHKIISGCMETTVLIGETCISDKFSYAFLREPRRDEIVTFNDPLYSYSSNRLYAFVQKYIWGPSDWTKRVIGLPGERIKGCVEEGKPVIYVDGKKISESYINTYPLVLVTPFDTGWRSYDARYSYDNQPFYKMNPIRISSLHTLLTTQGKSYQRLPYSPLADNKDIFEVQLKSKDKDGIDEYWVMGDNRLASWDSRFFGPLKREFINGRIIVRLLSYDAAVDSLVINPINFFKRIRWNRFFTLLTASQKNCITVK